jgi:hypothetical protein
MSKLPLLSEAGLDLKRFQADETTTSCGTVVIGMTLANYADGA